MYISDLKDGALRRNLVIGDGGAHEKSIQFNGCLGCVGVIFL